MFGISRDSVWSHLAWAQSLGIDFTLLSDWNGDATRACGVAVEPLGMADVSRRAVYLVDADGTVREAWSYQAFQAEDVDALLAAARAL